MRRSHWEDSLLLSVLRRKGYAMPHQPHGEVPGYPRMQKWAWERVIIPVFMGRNVRQGQQAKQVGDWLACRVWADSGHRGCP